ncbi:hypothetical protein VTL71DRAFT_14388 [Oculimacula yallundae]|uniref:Uncharacterized protein n=1 Tax=Oculimacula yallundae TaxID=86028 RepID=A0ABR4CKM8_9HELO
MGVRAISSQAKPTTPIHQDPDPVRPIVLHFTSREGNLLFSCSALKAIRKEGFHVPHDANCDHSVPFHNIFHGSHHEDGLLYLFQRLHIP